MLPEVVSERYSDRVPTFTLADERYHGQVGSPPESRLLCIKHDRGVALAVLRGREYSTLIDRDGLSPLEDTGCRWPLDGTLGWWEEPRGYDRNGELFTAPPDAIQSVDRNGESKRPEAVLPETLERRLSRREPLAILVMIRRSADSESPDWAGNAADINDSGMALVLPPELATGTVVFLSFKLGDNEFSGVPAEIVRQESVGIGAVHFVDWSDADRLELVSYLQETDGLSASGIQAIFDAGGADKGEPQASGSDS